MKKILLSAFFCLLMSFFLNVEARSSLAQLQEIKTQESTKSASLTFETDKPITTRAFTLAHPNRLVVDLIQTQQSSHHLIQLGHHQFIQSMRIAPQGKGTIRIVFDLAGPASLSGLPHHPEKLTHLTLHFSQLSQHRDELTQELLEELHEDQMALAHTQNSSSQSKTLKQTQQQEAVAAVSPDAALPKQNQTALPDDPTQQAETQILIAPKQEKPQTQARSKEARTQLSVKTDAEKQIYLDADDNPTAESKDSNSDDQQDTSGMSEVAPKSFHGKIIVVIDPGHGGKDPGASGPRNTKEKNVVLDISREIQRDINQQPGFKALLTRSGDYYITLRQRLQIARKDKGDLFVAIHADAYMNNDATGASVFALSQSGATSEAAHWLANNENYSELGGVQDFGDKSYLVRSVLLDLSQTVTISQSLQVGYVLLSALKHVTTLHHNIVEQARFMVLKSPDIPSLLVETGFITNPREEDRLNSPGYQQKLASALAAGIIAYFREHPPQDVAGPSGKTNASSVSVSSKHHHKPKYN